MDSSTKLMHTYATRIKVSNGTSTYIREQLCQIILRYINKYRSYGQEKSRQMDTQSNKATLC